ncbi:MAG: thiol-disulfide oxidoreductase DCC family protein [Opitutales bacterium]
MSEVEQPILFFDGVCNLCNAAVRVVLRLDRRGRLLLAPLQGAAARAHLPEELRDVGEHGSLVLWRPAGRDYAEAGTFVRSDAVLEVARQLSWPWKAARVLRVVPRPWRDAVYRWVARNRYAWFGRAEACRLPTPEERARFLD